MKITLGALHRRLAIYVASVLLPIALFAPVNAASADQAFVTGAALGPLRNDFSGWVGMQIAVGANPLTVSQLGRIMAPGNNGTHTIKLVKASDGTDVPNGSVAVGMSGGTPGEFRYGILSSPATLAAGTNYWVVSQEAGGGDQWYDWHTTLLTTPVAAADGVVWGSGAGWFPFRVANRAYVPVNFKYATAATTERILTVASANPNSGVTITVSPADNGGLGTGVTAVPRRYNNNTVVTLTAPATAGGNAFQMWQRDGVDFSPNPSITATMDADHALTAVYSVDRGIVTSMSLGTLINSAWWWPPGTVWLGAHIKVGAVPLRVSQLGRLVAPGNSGTHLMKIVEFKQAGIIEDVPGGSVSVNTSGVPAGQFTYGILSSPLTLAARKNYFVVSQETSGGDALYENWDTSVTTDEALERISSASYGTLPFQTWTLGATPGQLYGPIDIKFGTSTTEFVTGFGGLGPLRNDYSGWVGMQFVVGAKPMTVLQLGRMIAPSNSGTHTLKLVSAADGIDVPGSSVSVTMAGKPTGQFQYGTLDTPVRLDANTTYWVLSLETALGDTWYDWHTTLTTNVDAAANGLAWGTVPGDWVTYPVENHGFGPLNIKYATIVPPTFVTGLVGVGTLRNDYSGWIGMQFFVGDTPLRVSHLGRMMAPGNSGTHTVKLVKASDETDVPGGEVTIAMSGGTVGEFKYGTLTNPPTLEPDTSYWLLTKETAGGDSWYANQEITTTAAAEATGVIVGTGPGAWTVTPISDRANGPVDFKY